MIFFSDKEPTSEASQSETPSTTTKALPEPDLGGDNDNSNNSSSSEDRKPLADRIEMSNNPGAKRKAEVLSEESGKIGVTITTSNGGSGSNGTTSPTTKVSLCLLFIL